MEAYYTAISTLVIWLLYPSLFSALVALAVARRWRTFASAMVFLAVAGASHFAAWFGPAIARGEYLDSEGLAWYLGLYFPVLLWLAGSLGAAVASVAPRGIGWAGRLRLVFICAVLFSAADPILTVLGDIIIGRF